MPWSGGFIFRLFVLVLVLAATTALRAAVGSFVPGVPFAFYYPAAIVVTFLCGWEFGALTLLLGATIAWYLFVPPFMQLRLPTAEQTISIAAMLFVGGCLIGLTAALRMALERAQLSEARYRELVDVTSGIVCVSDKEGRISEPQHGWTQITGMAWPQYRDLGWLEAVHEDDRALLKGARRTNAPGFQQAEVRIWSAAAKDWRWFNLRAMPLRDNHGEIEGWISAFSDIHQRKLARERQELMLAEQRHRLKNLITVIDSLAVWSNPQNDPGVNGFLKKFLGRLRALGSVGDQIVAADWKDLQADSVIRAALAPFMEDDLQRFTISGPPLALSEQTAGSVALAIHEMATNALKYGALSVKDGKVRVNWSKTAAPDGTRVTIEWREEGGPPAAPPQREGFGLRLIRYVPARERDGDVQMDFGAAGFSCRIAFTADPDRPEPAAG